VNGCHGPVSCQLAFRGALARELRGAHHGGQNLVVIGAAAEVAGNAVCQLGACGTRVGLEEPDGGHDEARHAERALEALFFHHRLLHWVQCAIGGFEPFNRLNLPAADGVRENRARIMRHIVDEHVQAPHSDRSQPSFVPVRPSL
jgi:hypothetical protein